MGGTSKTTANALKKEIRDPGTAFTVTTHYEQFDAFGNPGKAIRTRQCLRWCALSAEVSDAISTPIWRMGISLRHHAVL